MKIKELLKKTFLDKYGKQGIAQFPNFSGGITVVLIILGRIFSTGVLHTILRGSAAITGLYWSYLEIRYGVNYFRKILGALVAVMILKQIIQTLI